MLALFSTIRSTICSMFDLRIVPTAVLLSACLMAARLAPAADADASITAPYPLEYFALREVIDNAAVAPDGQHLGVLKIASRDANPVIEIYPTGNLEAEPFRIDADPMEIIGFRWVSDRDIVMSLRQRVRKKIDDFNEGVYEYRIAKVDIETRKMRAFDDDDPAIENVLPNDPRRIIISLQPGGDRNTKIDEAFRPRAYYALDLDTGNKRLLLRGKLSLGQIEFDGNGEPWIAHGFDIDTGSLVWYHRPVGTQTWKEFHRQSEDSFETFEVVGFDPDARHIFFVMANNGRDTVGLWEFDVARGAFGELIYQRSDVDVVGVRWDSRAWTRPDHVAGVAWAKDRIHIEYFDPEEEALYAQIEGLIPHASTPAITSRSRDGNTFIVYNDGPRDPGTFYLVENGKLARIGSKQPLLEAGRLADVRYIEVKARDGSMIPAYVTVPSTGQAPFPAVVLPHGGPFVSEVVDYDEWGQLLANNGYLVIQPQYRGSRGHGLAHYTTAFVSGGQGGYQMQDDKDDVAQALVRDGLASADRLAMFGWSYGGYAALIAASRTPQIYQCVIAGAAVADTVMQVNYYRDLLRGAAQIEQLNMWQDSINPINEVAKVNVPMLIVHGSVDQRVPIAHAKRYLAALDKHGKRYRYIELDGADHFSDTLFFDHQLTLYRGMIDYLRDDCGPGGL
ncbi:MAG: alpha/beta hydrolase family protein [Gammaproteobacteria bacterium]